MDAQEIISYLQTADLSTVPGRNSNHSFDIFPLAQGEYNLNYRICQAQRQWVFRVNLGTQIDRIDIHVEMPRVDYEKLSSDYLGESSASIREREQQRVRFEGTDIICPVRKPGLSKFQHVRSEGTSVLQVG